MSDWTRYTCQLNLPRFDNAAQQKLADAKVLIVGIGGLGCPVAQYLASSGIGELALADNDVISVKNLHRQTLYTPMDVGEKKVDIACARLHAQNPDIHITAIDAAATASNVMDIISRYNIVVDCSDNFETRYLLNDACVLSGKPLVYGAIYQYEGQVAIWNHINNNGTQSPNYRDLFPDVNAAAIPNCADGGVIPTIAGIIGCMQANEAIKYITGIGDLLAGKLLVFDAETMQSRILKLGAVTKTNITCLPTFLYIDEITADELHASMDKYLLVDVRTAEERSKFNIGGIHIPLPEIEKANIQLTSPIVCYCASGKRSAQAVKILTEKHPSIKFLSLKGGVDKWPRL